MMYDICIKWKGGIKNGKKLKKAYRDVTEFHMGLKEAFNNASILARGISDGGAYLGYGYGYGYVKCIGFLSTAMMGIGDG